MKLNIIADGVKKEYQRKKLINKKILLHQGSLYSPPIHASEFPIKLQANNHKNLSNDSVPSTISHS
ncbi:hypothetical protein GQF02_12760 [Neisseriaceae bacterium B2N2-7]|uniref:EAL domain-containing protein n=1 Tax=Craterilacuibacter sinensis TaxID=2686017 RepID=A0A845BUK3_9NEIS|nr:hypothetical protein [Craterilacuibacter sinensis]